LVRHGHARSADDRVVAGHAGCRGLSDLGRRQAEALRDRLAVQRFRPDAVVTSLLPRAVETAEIVAEGLVDDPSAIPRDCDLCERHPGDADGWSWEELAARHGGVDPVRHPDRPPAPGGESGRAMRQRVVATVAQLSHRYPGRTVLVVTHAGVILHATLHLLGLGPRWFAHDLANTSVTEWVRDGEGRWLLGRFNDAAHLEALGA
ncbi:MAG TPA: histidine phosphatase family protein, partial [Acidimicrobiales bacterium]